MATQNRTSSKRTINLKQLLKCVGLIVLAVYLCVTLINQRVRINAHEQQTREYRVRIEEAIIRGAILEETLSQVGTEEHMERVARETLRLTMPGDRVFIDSGRIR